MKAEKLIAEGYSPEFVKRATGLSKAAVMNLFRKNAARAKQWHIPIPKGQR
jgi:hypothetical protein